MYILLLGRGGAYTQDENTYAGTWAKNAGGLMREVGVIAGFFGIIIA